MSPSMIIGPKVLMYPPTPSTPNKPPSPTLATLPPHILLQVVYSTFPQTPSFDQGKIERQRKTILWLVNSLRLVSRSLYIGEYLISIRKTTVNTCAACMHLLRSIYLPAYRSLIRSPYTSDPFPTTTTNSRSPTYTSKAQDYSQTHPIQSLQRETAVLDRFIALKVREDVFLDESELHLEREDMFKDLFDHAQPKARLEDLVRSYGIRKGVIRVPGVAQSNDSVVRGDGVSGSAKQSPSQSTSSLANALPSSPKSSSQPKSTASRFFGLFNKSKSGSNTSKPEPSSTQQVKIKPISFYRISISLSPRTIGLVVASGANKRTLVQIQRGSRDQKLETEAKLLVNELKNLLVSEAYEPRN